MFFISDESNFPFSDSAGYKLHTLLNVPFYSSREPSLIRFCLDREKKYLEAIQQSATYLGA